MLASVWNACVSVQCRPNSKHPRSTGLVPSRSGVFTHFLGKGFIRLTCASLGVFERVAYAEVEQVLFVTGNGNPVTIGLT